MLKGQMAGLCCSTRLCNMANGSGSLLFYYKQITCKGWIICPGQPGASYCLALSIQSFFSPFQVSSCYFCWCSSISDSKRKHVSAWCLTMVPARSPPKRFRKWFIGQIPAFTRHRSRQAALFACWFGYIWMEWCIWGRVERREGTTISKFSKIWKDLLRKIQLGTKKAIKTQCGS